MYLPQGIEAINVVKHGRSPGYGAWIAVVLVSVSSLAGAWLARRNSTRVVVWLAIASATMLVIAMTDLLPDAWREASETGVPWWAIGIAAAVGFAVITYFTRKGCGCEADSDKAAGRHAPGRHRRLKQAVDTALFSGMGTAAALTTHRAIEGATLALTASVVVVIALMVHSASEGLALAALLDIAKQRLAPWLAVACAAPAIGVLAATIHPLPGKVVPILLSMISGVLTRTAIVGLKLAASQQAGGRLSRRQVMIAGLGAFTIGALIVAAHTSEDSQPARTRTQPVRLTPSPAQSLPRTQPPGAPERGRPENRRQPRSLIPRQTWYSAEPARRIPATQRREGTLTAPERSGEPDRGGLSLTHGPENLRVPGRGGAEPGPVGRDGQPVGQAVHRAGAGLVTARRRRQPQRHGQHRRGEQNVERRRVQPPRRTDANARPGRRHRATIQSPGQVGSSPGAGRPGEARSPDRDPHRRLDDTAVIRTGPRPMTQPSRRRRTPGCRPKHRVAQQGGTIDHVTNRVGDPVTPTHQGPSVVVGYP